MSWLGEQFSSFTEKLTEITKDVLVIDDGNKESGEGSSQQINSPSPEELLKICKEKDSQIQILMNEKVSLEKGIEELDFQHQEAIDELLQLKNEAVKKNMQMREEFNLERNNMLAKSLLLQFEHLQIKLKFGDNQPVSQSSIENSMKNINLVNILGILWKSLNRETLTNFIKWLRDQKYSLEIQTENPDVCPRNVVNKINSYIEFLEHLYENTEIFSPIIDEIAAVIHFLLSRNYDSNFSVPNEEGGQCNNIQSSVTNTETCDFNEQIILPDFRHVKNLFSESPEPFMCNYARGASGDCTVGYASHHSQTDEDGPVQDCGIIIHEMKEYILMIEQEKLDLQEQVSELEERVQLLSTPSPSTSSEGSQTDESLCDYVNLKSKELEMYITILEQEKADLKEEISKLNATIRKDTSSSKIQTDEYDCICKAHVYELETLVNDLEQERSELKNDMIAIQTQLNKAVSSIMIQTDDYNCNCNTYELQANICILEQNKADLQNENLQLQNLLNKETFSICIQTDETVGFYDTLQTEISDLKETLMTEKSVFDDRYQEIMKTLFNAKEELKIKESEISEREQKIKLLECILEEYENKTKIEPEVTHVSTPLAAQFNEKKCSCELFKLEIADLRNCIKEKENYINAIECEMTVIQNNLKDEIKSKKLCINEMEITIQSLKSEIKKYQNCIKDLSEKCHPVNLTTIGSQTDEIKCLCESYSLEILELKKCIEERDKEFAAAQNQLVVSINDLKEEMKLKEFLINEKDAIIQSLKCRIEDHESSIRELSTKVYSKNSSTSVEVQTDESNWSCELYKSQILELEKSVEEKEKEFKTIQIQMTDSIDSLKNELYSNHILIADKDSIVNSLNLNLEQYRNDIKYLTDELNRLKSFSNISSNDYCSSCKKYEYEVADLKMYINEKEKIFNTTQNDLLSNLDNLKEVTKSKDSIIIEKEVTIRTLQEELDDVKRNMKTHFLELAQNPKHDYAKDIDTMEEREIERFVQNCNICKNSVNGETKENDFINEMKSLQEKLKALDLDKSQLLCVLNEKSQECSTLKAEVHKLMNIVASEKQALFKLQQDNCILKESKENSDPELTKETIKKLSQIIRDKDLEIESLKQKNLSLTTLIHDGELTSDNFQLLMEERENLTKQINILKADRDKIMVRYNAVDKDCRQYTAEVKKLRSALSHEKEKFDVLEQKHFSVAQQFEEKQKSLINTQNEMIALKQRVTDLEKQQVDIKEKYSELLNKVNAENMIQVSKDELEEKNSQIEQLISSNSEKDHLIQEKDCLILDLSQQVKTLKHEHEQQQSTLSNIQVKFEELSVKFKEQEASVEKHQSEREALELRYQDKNSEIDLLKEMNERLNMNLKEKEFTVQSMTEKISSLSHYISSDHTSSDTVDINQILADSESMFSKAQSLHKERDETLLALSQSKQENQSLRNEIQRMKSNEIHLKKELERLRMHLLEIEENYTTEALKAEEREKDLRDELVEVKRRAEISNTAVVDTNQRASIQIISLQEQLSMIANQRDQALAQVSSLEDKVHQQSASISKLQLVLEQMQRANERKVKDTEKKFTTLLENQKQKKKELEEKLQAKEMQLEETSHALDAASRLSEQLDAKEEIIAHLKNELAKTESKIKSTAQEIDTIKSNTEGKVDRVVMKSLVLGYFSTPPGQKSEVIRLLARVLDFNQEEMEKAGIVVGRNASKNEQRGLLSSIFGRLPSLSSDRVQHVPQKSFTTLFVQFLENESQPIVPMPFPVEKMTPELPFKQPTGKKSPTTQYKTLSRNNPLLLDIDSAFPTFTPVPAVEYSQSPAPSILREVLE